MKITSVWRGNKPNHKKKRTVPKLRIRWTQLGLVDPSVDALRVRMPVPVPLAPLVDRPDHNQAGLFDHRSGKTNRRREPSHEQAKPPSRNAIEKKRSK